MTFSQYAGTSIVPTLSRLVLAAVFVIAGWNKVFKYAEFTAEQATRLKGLNVNVEPISPIVMDDRTSRDPAVVFARFSPQDPATPPAGDAVPPVSDAGASPPPNAPPAATPPATQPLAPGKYKAQALHYLTLMLEDNQFPLPVWQARLAAFTELVGGAMLLLGLFSRIWGLGLSIAMGVAFYLTSMKMHNVLGVNPLELSETNPMAMATASLQVSLFVLAFGILLTGAGPLSLDRMLFGGGGDADPGEAKID